MTLPAVLDEWSTIRLISDTGASLCRFGDGEVKLMMGHDIKSQSHDEALGKRLRRIAAAHDPRVVVAIPPIYEEIKPSHRGFWARYAAPERARYFANEEPYGSSFVTRLDYHPDLDCEDYWALIRGLWAGREVLCVTGGGQDSRWGRTGILAGADRVDWLNAPQHGAWAAYEALLEHCRAWRGLVVAAVGPTATVLAWDLGTSGVQCLDLGHLASFYGHSAVRAA
jgi:hypothetical protein